jgi:hypothetical protein
LDDANNASDFIADSFSVVTYTPAVVTPTTPSEDTSGDLNGNGATDEASGNTDTSGEVKGTEDNTNTNTTDNTSNTGSSSKINPIWYWVLGISLGAAAIWTVIKTGIWRRVLGR